MTPDPSQKKSKRSRLPLHVAISEMLAREIKAGVLLEGEKLEPERAMAQRLGIAVGTLRKALAELHQQGLLERVQGSGNYVRTIDANDNNVYGFFRLELLGGGGEPTATTLSVERVDAEPAISFSEQAQYDRIRRVRFLDDQPAALEEVWLDAAYSTEPLSVDDLTDSLYQHYKAALGFWIARVEDSLTVDTSPSWQPVEFGEVENSVCGYVERRSWDQINKQAEYSRTWFNPAVCRYVARWK